MKKLSVAIAIIVALLLLGLSFSGGAWFASTRAESRMDDLISALGDTREELQVAKNRTVTLDKALLNANEDRQELLDTIAALKSKPSEIRYIVKTKTTVEPAAPATVVTANLPARHDFKLANDLIVAEFEATESEYSFRTHNLSLRGTMVIGKRDSSLIIEGSTSAAPKAWKELPVELDVQHIAQHQVVGLNIGLGVSGGPGISLGTKAPTGNAYGALTASLIHPNDDIDLLQLRVGTNGRALMGGLDPVSWNIAKRLPIFTDLWFSPAGVSVDTAGDVIIGPSLSSKF
jgi:hypothetical protein